MVEGETDGEARVWENRDLNGHEREHTCAIFVNMWRRQGGDKRVPVSNVLGRMRCKESEVCGGLCNDEGERISMKVTNVRKMGLWWNNEIGGKGEEVLEREGKRVFENGKCCLEEVVCRMGKLIEEDALNRDTTTKPWKVEESEGKGG
ncbi:hypothetical protein DEO72_LG10g838 [Vigna unguiculata]|uniref:Uncharacterized protein n=1 Tax=Vigna unguiculata TaxID=3917 RepID=A0A4D6NCI2_VIGUN|nr:hypothetical protein DEO72_LG10g838 [Vigna unguiculata]